MEKHEVVNQILDYLETRHEEAVQELNAIPVGADNFQYMYLEGVSEAYSHLIAKLEDDYR